MAFLFIGSEPSDFTVIGSVLTYTFSSSNARSVVRGSTNIGITSANKEIAYAKSVLKSSASSIWVTFRLSTIASTSANMPLFFIGNAGKRRIGIIGTGTSGILALAKIDNTNVYTTLATANSIYTASTVHKYDMQINYGTSGSINLYRANADGTSSTLIANYTGDVTTNGESILSELYLGGLVNASASVFFSEVIVADEDTRGLGLEATEMIANGNTHTMSGSYVDIDDTSTNDADMVTATADGQIAQYTFNTSRISTTNTKRAVVICHRSRAGASVPKLTPNLRLGGTDYFGTQITPTSAFENYQEIFEINPATGVGFTAADLTATGVNFGLRANV